MILEEKMDKIASATADQIRTDIPDFKAGDVVSVEYKIIEGNRERIQRFQGTVIARRGSGINATFTVRKISDGIGVERIFPLHSPKINCVTVVTVGKVRRAKLYYLRNLKGKAAKVKAS